MMGNLSSDSLLNNGFDDGREKYRYDTSRMSRSIFIVSLMRALSLPHPFSNPNSPNLPHISSLETYIATCIMSHLVISSGRLSAITNARESFFRATGEFRWIVSVSLYNMSWSCIAWDPVMHSCLLAHSVGPFLKITGWSQCLKTS